MCELAKGFDTTRVSVSYDAIGKKHKHIQTYCNLRNGETITKEQWQQRVKQYVIDHNEQKLYDLYFDYVRYYPGITKYYHSNWDGFGKYVCEDDCMEGYADRRFEWLRWMGYESFRKVLLENGLVEADMVDGWIELKTLQIRRGIEMSTAGAEKITAQIDGWCKSNPLAKVLGSYLIGLCETNPEVDAAIVAIEDVNKRLDFVAKHITQFARGKATGGCAMLEDTEVFGEVNKFLGINHLIKPSLQVVKPVVAPQVVEKEVVKEVVVEKVVEAPAAPPKPKKAKAKEPVAGQFDLFSMGV